MLAELEVMTEELRTHVANKQASVQADSLSESSEAFVMTAAGEEGA